MSPGDFDVRLTLHCSPYYTIHETLDSRVVVRMESLEGKEGFLE